MDSKIDKRGLSIIAILFILISQVEASAPQRVKYAVFLLWSAISLGVMVQLLELVFFNQSEPILQTALGLFFALAIHSYLIYRVAKGGHSALLLYFLMIVLGNWYAHPHLSFESDNPIDFGIQIFQLCLQLLAFYWLFSKTARSWFKKIELMRQDELKKPVRLIHPDGKLRSIYLGFNLLAFLLTALWAISERLWRPLGFALLALFIARLLSNSALVEGNHFYGAVASLLYLCTMIIFGLHGNGWLINALEQQGYRRIEED